MFRFRFSLASLLLFCSAGAFAQGSNFTLQPQLSKPGESVAITYDPNGTPLEGQKDVHAVVYAFNNYKWQTSDLTLIADGNKYKGTLKLAKDCGFVAMKFLAGDSTDNNHDRGYAIMLIDPVMLGRNAAGAYAGWGLLRAENLGYGVPGYLKAPVLTDTILYYWLDQEATFHGKEAGSAIAVPFASAINGFKGQAGLPRINKILAYLKNSGTEGDLIKSRSIYQNVLGKKESADSLDEVMAKQFPKGDIARLKAYKAFNNERDLAKKGVMGVQFLDNFKQSDADAEFNRQNRISYGNVYQTLIIIGVMNKDYKALKQYTKELPYDALLNVYYKVIQISHDRKDESDTVLYPYAQELVNRMEEFKTAIPADYWYLSPLEWAKQYEGYVSRSVFPTHISVLRNTGHNAEALAYAERAEQVLAYKNASVNDHYAYFLNKTDKDLQLHEVLVKSMYENQSSEDMLKMLKADYIRENKNEEGFDAYLRTLKNPALAAEDTERAKLEMRKDIMPDWSMYDLNGKLVKFSDLRGKTVVMDFWATWCVPCKASFPGMKLAVDRYKNDPNVVFYFVDTEERTKDYKKEVAKYIKDNNYPFQVLFDNKKNGATMNNEVYEKLHDQFHISGIPMKLIIDAKGYLRFLTDGYKGSPTGLADEIGEMVELVKKAD